MAEVQTGVPQRTAVTTARVLMERATTESPQPVEAPANGADRLAWLRQVREDVHGVQFPAAVNQPQVAACPSADDALACLAGPQAMVMLMMTLMLCMLMEMLQRMSGNSLPCYSADAADSIPNEPPATQEAAPSSPPPSDNAPSSHPPSGNAPSSPPPSPPTTNEGATPSTPPREEMAGTRIGGGNRVLMIGDSHTVGAFGSEMDRRLRASGAYVETYGSSRSSPSWWRNGTQTHSGYAAIDGGGHEERPQWNSPHDTPRLADLMAREHPDTVIINMGANMRDMPPQKVTEQVQKLLQVAKANGSRVIWIGPPPQRSDGSSDGADYRRFNDTMRAAVGADGTYIDSSRAVTQYQGSDPNGIHFDTAGGRAWADRIFSAVQGDS